MKSVTIHEAKTPLSKLVEQAAQGEPFLIAKAGKPMVKVMAIDAPVGKKIRRMGFMKERYPSRITWTGCSKKRLSRCFTVRNEPAFGYSPIDMVLLDTPKSLCSWT